MIKVVTPRTVVLSMVWSGLAGCTLVQEQLGMAPQSEPLTPENSAQVDCETGSRRLLFKDRNDAELLSIAAIDKVSTFSYWRAVAEPTPYATTTVLTPGPHTLQVQYRDAVFLAETELSFAAEAGQSYKLHKSVQGLSVHFWVEDAAGRSIAAVDSGEIRR